MKRILIMLAIVMAMSTISAQEHLSFKGIPIEGSMASFSQKLESKGFAKIGSKNNAAFFDGNFTGRHAMVCVLATDDGNSVHSVAVAFDQSEEWNTLVNTYNYYKDIYTRKYGEPTINKEDNPSKSDSNVALMHELLQGRVTYVSGWNVTGGTIELSIEKANTYSDGVVIVKYRDAQNVENKIKNDLDDI